MPCKRPSRNSMMPQTILSLPHFYVLLLVCQPPHNMPSTVYKPCFQWICIVYYTPMKFRCFDWWWINNSVNKMVQKSEQIGVHCSHYFRNEISAEKSNKENNNKKLLINAKSYNSWTPCGCDSQTTIWSSANFQLVHHNMSINVVAYDSFFYLNKNVYSKIDVAPPTVGKNIQ